jgi:hypothetical protein
MSRVSAAVSTKAGISARPVTAALYRRWQPSISSGPAGSPGGPVRVARIAGSPGSVVMAYSGLKSGPGPIRETACRPLPGSRTSP